MNKEDCETTPVEEMNNVYYWLLDFFLLTMKYENINDDEFNDCTPIIFKNTSEIKKSIIDHRDKRKKEFEEMVKETFCDGESKRVGYFRTKENNYILELNLIQTDKEIGEYLQK